MKRILIIEDDSLQRELYKTVLEQAGYKVFESPDGEKGLKLLSYQSCDLVITDIFMPEKEGLETILEVKAIFPEMKIIAISGGGFRTHSPSMPGADVALEAAKGFGATRVLKKPFTMRYFVFLVNELLFPGLSPEGRI